MSRRTAAALLITRGAGTGLEVFLGDRSPELRFFGGYEALPGGTVDDVDRRADEGSTLRACAERELFEETGLLWSPARARRDELVALRMHMLQHERADRPAPPPRGPRWADLVFDAGPPLRALCRIETPPFAPVRYDTVFYHVPLERCTPGTGPLEPEIWPGELVAGRFVRPADALLQWRRAEILLVPPVVVLFEHLAAAGNFDAFAATIAATTDGYREGHLHRVRFSPGIELAPLRTPTLPPAVTTNCLLVGKDPLYVVDPGSPHADEQQRLLRLLDELAAEGARPAGILVTHHHHDHIGGVHALSAARDLPVHGHALTLVRLQPGFRRGEALADGAILPLGTAPDGSPGWQLRALHTPGHDQGHLCFFESRYRALIVGDMLSTVSTIIVDPPEGHLATYLHSLERLGREPMTTLYPAHGPAQRDGHRLVRHYLRHRRQRESTLVRALQQAAADGATIDELLPMVYWDADPRLFVYAARSLQAGLEKLGEERRAEERDGRWHVVGDGLG
jgi:glyoxylase-like metal-dependent hydrolase (beta-lactamase superfamily II)/8-oxo-dGTP pyrophosphatase MutT (NUDIX family)